MRRIDDGLPVVKHGTVTWRHAGNGSCLRDVIGGNVDVLWGFLWVAIEGIAGCGYRRRTFRGMSQVSKCTLPWGHWLRRL